MSPLFSYFLLYVAAFATCTTLDLTWLTMIAKSFYTKNLGYLMAPSPNLWAALLFYVLFIAGILIFVVLPALKEDSFLQVALKGFFFGLIVYSAYDLTNHATVKDWPAIVTVVDMFWGATVSCIVSSVSFLLARALII